MFLRFWHERSTGFIVFDLENYVVESVQGLKSSNNFLTTLLETFSVAVVKLKNSDLVDVFSMSENTNVKT